MSETLNTTSAMLDRRRLLKGASAMGLMAGAGLLGACARRELGPTASLPSLGLSKVIIGRRFRINGLDQYRADLADTSKTVDASVYSFNSVKFMFRRFDPVSGLVLEETAPGVADNNSLFFFMSTGHAVMNEFSKARAAVMGLFSLGISALDSQPLQQTTYGDFTVEAGDWVLERVTTASGLIPTFGTLGFERR